MTLLLCYENCYVCYVTNNIVVHREFLFDWIPSLYSIKNLFCHILSLY